MLEQINEAADHIKSVTNSKPHTGIILGSGLGQLVDVIENPVYIPYSKIPHFPVSTVKGHLGRLIIGHIGEDPVVVMQGRFHYYEGYPMDTIAFPVRVMRMLGIERLIVSNAAGGVNPAFEIGDLMIIRDHINLFPGNPLIGPNDEKLGVRFPDMSEAYDKRLIEHALKVGRELDLPVHTGVYAGVTGPMFETPAEYKFLSVIGADAVGMSTIPEVITARHLGIQCFGLSVITDLGVEGKIVEVTHEEVLQIAEKHAPKLTTLVSRLISH